MANLTNPMEILATDYFARAVTPPALTGPINAVLLSALGTSDAAGTPVTGTVLAYGPTAAGTNPASNAALIRWEGLANPTDVAGFRLQDSAATPVVTLDNIARTGGTVSVTGGIFEVPAGGLTATSA